MAVPSAPPQAPSGVPSTGPVGSCTNCTAPLAVGQDWCLECGTAVPGRLRGGPGLRSSLGVVGVTLLLVIGAVAAGYATLSSDSKRAAQTTASLPAQTSLTPDAPPGAAAPAVPTTAAPTAALPTAPKVPAATPTPAPAPVTVAPKTAAPKTSATTPVGGTTKTKTPSSSGASTPSAKTAKILLDTDAATTYNPYSLAASNFGDPAKAIDGDPTTAWTYQLDPSTAGRTLVGLVINLKADQRVRDITVKTATPGMTVEFYGAPAASVPPVSITDPAWLHLANRKTIKASAKVTLMTAGQSLQYLLVWITHAPAGVTTGTLGVSELSVTS
ncbi:MAG: hypothetical protein ACR2KV_16870 [Solirubrobacteraceae bacterium]